MSSERVFEGMSEGVSGGSREHCVSPASVMEFMSTVGRLKLLKRTGWVRSGVHLPESVAEHMYKMSMLTFMLRDAAVDRDRLMKICMLHDLAEAIVGDITPHCNVSKEEKRQLEETALRKIAADLNHPHIEEEFVTLWLEYENSSSLEAEIAHQLDKLEMIMQANEYEEQQNMVLDDFFESTQDSFTHPEVMSWANELRQRRAERQQKATLQKVNA